MIIYWLSINGIFCYPLGREHINTLAAAEFNGDQDSLFKFDGTHRSQKIWVKYKCWKW